MNLTLSRVSWNDTAAAILAPVCADDPAGLADVEIQVQTGAASLFKVHSPNRLVGFYVVRIDHTANGDDLVIIAGAGRLPGVNLIAVMLPTFEAQAAMSDCNAVRIHTNRRGMVKQIARRGYRFAEWVFRKEISK